MKKYFFCAAIAIVAACTVEEPSHTEFTYPHEVSARIEDHSANPETRVYADENLKVLWDNDDRITLFNKYTYNKEYRFTGSTGANSGVFQEVNTGEVITGNQLDYVYAVYPYMEQTEISNSGVITLGLPAEQPYKEYSFGRGANTMVSATQNTELLFKNLCGYLVLKLYGDGVSVSSIALTGNNDEPLAGTVDVTASTSSTPSLAFRTTGSSSTITLNCETPVAIGSTAEDATVFWLVVPPTTFEGGFTLTVTDSDGNTFVKNSTTSKQIVRNSTYRVKALEVVMDAATLPVPDAIDLGLSVKWASFNLGASNPEEFGEYYAWGEVVPKNWYYWDTYKWCDGTDNSLTKYNSESDYGTVDNKYILDLEDDAAHNALRADWRMPSTKEWEELINPNNCDWTWTTQNEVNGYLVTSKRTDNSIFLPVAGYKSYDEYYPCNSSFTYYWLNELIDPNDGKWTNTNYYRFSDKASAGNFRQTRIDSDWKDRYSGLPIRPVQTADESVLTCDDHLDLWLGYTRSVSVTERNSPGDALSYFSKDENIVTIDNNGTVHAVGVGTATIRVSTADGANSAYCSVTVYPAPEIIDMGLSVKWASFNIGATSPEDRGFLLAWGETLPKSTYSWATYKWCNGSNTTLTKYNTISRKGIVDNKVILDDEDDVAKLWSNGHWRMPTKAEVDELYRNCERASSDGNRSATYTSTINGNSIFFPIANYNYAIWTSELEEGIDYPDFALCLAPGGWQSDSRCGGLTVRAVLVEE